MNDNTTLCYIENSGAYLMMHRVKKKNDENHDKWIGIGGHIEPGEDPYDCIIRETREETGLTLENPEYRGLITFVLGERDYEFMHLFYADRYSGELLSDCSEGELCWLPKEKLRSLPLWEGDFLFLALLERRTPFFSLKLCYDRDGNLLSHTLRFADGKPPLLISACLCGCTCRYDGLSRPLSGETLDTLSKRYALIPVCPEQLGGLPTPRIPAERQEDGSVLRRDFVDVTAEYRRGAEEALRIGTLCGARTALLKARSPSCGVGRIYSGKFDGTFRDGYGTTAELLREHGYTVYSEETMEELLRD